MRKNDEKAAKRLARMEELIETQFGGNGSAFARAAGKSPSQIQDMRSDKTRKSFGEKVARTMEISLRKNHIKIPVGYLENPDIPLGDEVREPAARYARSALIGESYYESDELDLLDKLLGLPQRVRSGFIEAIIGAHEIAPATAKPKRKAAAPVQ